MVGGFSVWLLVVRVWLEVNGVCEELSVSSGWLGWIQSEIGDVLVEVYFLADIPDKMG